MFFQNATNYNFGNDSFAEFGQISEVSSKKSAVRKKLTTKKPSKSSRVVNIVGTADENLNALSSYALNDSSRGNIVGKKLTDSGWSLLSPVEVVWDGNIKKFRFRVVANVLNQYGENEIIQGVRTAFIEATYVSTLSTYKLFTNVVAAIESGGLTTVQATQPSGDNSSNPTVKPTDKPFNLWEALGLNSDGGGGGFLTGLGLSTPIALLIGGVIVIIMLKK